MGAPAARQGRLWRLRLRLAQPRLAAEPASARECVTVLLSESPLPPDAASQLLTSHFHLFCPAAALGAVSHVLVGAPDVTDVTDVTEVSPHGRCCLALRRRSGAAC